MRKTFFVVSLMLLAVISIHPQKQTPLSQSINPEPQEKRLRNIRQLTFGGENAEAYFSADGKKLIFQSTRDGRGCDQIYTMNIDGSDAKMVSNGDGRTTCAYFFKNGKRLLYSSTHLGSRACPPRPDFSKGYVWAVYESFDLFTAKADGSDLKQLTTTPGYDAETTISRQGKLVFTSKRDGDLDIYTMDANGKNVRRLTNELGYDGGPFWSYDGKQIVYRAYHPQTQKERDDYTALLRQNLIRPTVLDIWVMNADGSNKRRVTKLNKASFAPFFFPDGKRVIFSSNVADPKGRDFDLYMIRTDGTGMERITFNNTFDGFPMFSPDGKSWCSLRIAMPLSRAIRIFYCRLGGVSAHGFKENRSRHHSRLAWPFFNSIGPAAYSRFRQFRRHKLRRRDGASR